MNQAVSSPPYLIAVLGSTGTVGVQTLDVVRRNPQQFKVHVLCAQRNIKKLYEQILEFSPKYVLVEDENCGVELRGLVGDRTAVLTGQQAIAEIVTLAELQIVVVGISGFGAFPAVVAALKAGKNLAIANKECFVSGGEYLNSLRDESASIVLPLDSEHSAAYQILRVEKQPLKKLVLTASGGPFLNFSREQMQQITPEEAVKHPKWKMGAKISIDSSNLMNKGLEVIEASYFFNLKSEQIAVLVHPESIVHALVEYSDKTQLACLYSPDMRLPISYALGFLASTDAQADAGGRIENNGVSAVSLSALSGLHFYEPDLSRFPALALAYESLRIGKNAPNILNAANEVAVSAFIDNKIRFLDIPMLVESVLEISSFNTLTTYQDIIECDQVARKTASELLLGYKI
jgi:1-deoxy-D-xylulose-5-phosphate reductoisomerase